jgi:hypothetical protein
MIDSAFIIEVILVITAAASVVVAAVFAPEIWHMLRGRRP